MYLKVNLANENNFTTRHTHYNNKLLPSGGDGRKKKVSRLQTH